MNEILEVVESYNSYIKNVVSGSLKIAEQLRNNEVKEAIEQIGYFSEGMSWLMDASGLLSQLKVEVAFDVEKIVEFLEEINNGLEIGDHVIVADIFEYEIAPFFDKLAQINVVEQ